MPFKSLQLVDAIARMQRMHMGDIWVMGRLRSIIIDYVVLRERKLRFLRSFQ
jgi:hypothetical protein